MELYRLTAEDGLEHFIRVLEVENDELACETVHKVDNLECHVDQHINRCLFEQLRDLGYIVPVSF